MAPLSRVAALRGLVVGGHLTGKAITESPAIALRHVSVCNVFVSEISASAQQACHVVDSIPGFTAWKARGLVLPVLALLPQAQAIVSVPVCVGSERLYQCAGLLVARLNVP